MATENTPTRGPGRPLKAETERKKRELNARQRAYVLWKATPEINREPKTQKDLAEVLGVSEQAIWKWSKDPRVTEAIRFVALQNAGDPVKVRQIVDMLFDVAITQQNPKVAEVWLKATGVFSQFGRTGDLLEIPDDAEADSFENYSLEELQRLRDEALAANLEQVTIELAQRKIAEADQAVAES
jgi:transcriptional regulator with XRE-family HTH domain